MRIKYTTVLLLVLTIAAASCSGADNADAVASLRETESEAPDIGEPSVSSEEEAEAAMLEFTQCLREQGVDVGDPTMDADGNLQIPPMGVTAEVEDDLDAAMAEMDTAFAECEEHLQGLTLGAPDPGAAVAFEDAFVEYAGCMRDHGIDMPDPDFSDDEGTMIELGQQSPGDQQAYEAAHRECRPILAGIGLEF